MKSYGINRKSELDSTEDFILEEFYNLGYTVIKNTLNESELKIYRDELDKIYKYQEDEFGKENLEKINESNLARMPLMYSELFVKLCSRKDLIHFVQRILGNFFVLHLQNGIINMPNQEHHQSSWHRDLPYQNWTSSEPLACNLYFCLDDFNNQTGATFLLPFSHKFSSAPSEKYMEDNCIQIDAPAGSVILFDSMLYHKAGFNSSPNIIRRGVNHVYVKPIINQQINLPEALNGKYQTDDLLSMLFGYKTILAKNVNEYRANRLNTKNK